MRFFIFCLLVLLGSGPVLCQSKEANDQRSVTEETVVDFNVNVFIKRIVEEAQEAGTLDTLSDALKRCYEKIANNYYTLPAEDVLQAMPEILQYAMAIERTKAWRPTAPFADIAPVVGPASQTNPSLYALLQMLAAIKKRIDCLGNTIAECCACDFFITQSATGGRNHPVNDPITVPGVYCLAEDVIGSIVIQTSNVTILFNGHTLTTATTTDAGILSDGNSRIRIQGGTITGAIFGVSLADGTECTVADMVFTGNTISLSVNAVQGFIVERCQFIANLSTEVSCVDCSYGTIALCLMTGNLNPTNYTAIGLTTCTQITCNDIIIARNIASAAFTGLSANSLVQSTLQNMHILYNAVTASSGATTSFYGIRFVSGSGNNSVVSCTVNNNTFTKTGGNIAAFRAFDVFDVAASSSNNNSFVDCQVNSNTISCSGIVDTRFVGVNIGGTVANLPTGANSSSNSRAQNCSVDRNSQTITGSGNAYMVGVNCGGTIAQGTITQGTCANCVFDGCTVNNNTNTAAGVAHFVGVNLGSRVGGGTVNAAVCGNNSLSNCTVNNNSSTGGSPSFFAGINLAGATSTTGTTGVGICSNCSVTNCMVNGNAEGSTSTAFFGINCAGILAGGASFFGNNCNECILQDISVSGNTALETVNFRGININGADGSTVGGGCNNIIATRCLINNNDLARTPSNASAFAGFFIDGSTVTANPGGANNLHLSACEVNDNQFNVGNLRGYLALGSAGETGAKNLQFEGCVTKNNRLPSTGSAARDGFVFVATQASMLQQCVSSGQTNHGFRFFDVVNSTVQECQAIGNDVDGFSLEGMTNNVTLIGCQSLGNGTDGFDFINTTTQCHIRQNIAQNNTNIGFNNEDGDLFKHQFINNYAQANGTNYAGVPIVVNPYIDPAPLNPFGNIET